jgi:hypothetical protein
MKRQQIADKLNKDIDIFNIAISNCVQILRRADETYAQYIERKTDFYRIVNEASAGRYLTLRGKAV